jgi:transcriptional regulator with XRE-family HTH domain
MPRGAPRLRTSDNRQNLIGAQVKNRRGELKLTQDALCARLAAITHGRWNPTIFDIYRIESGRRIVSDLELLALSIALECDMYDLVGASHNAPAFPFSAE